MIRQALGAVLEDQHEERKNVPAGISEHEQPDPLHSQPQPIAARRADALARIAEGWLAGLPQGNGGDRFLVHVHTDLDTLQADGGETHMHNLTLLCRHHHRLVHEGGFGLRSCEIRRPESSLRLLHHAISRPACTSPATMR